MTVAMCLLYAMLSQIDGARFLNEFHANKIYGNFRNSSETYRIYDNSEKKEQKKLNSILFPHPGNTHKQKMLLKISLLNA